MAVTEIEKPPEIETTTAPIIDQVMEEDIDPTILEALISMGCEVELAKRAIKRLTFSSDTGGIGYDGMNKALDLYHKIKAEADREMLYGKGPSH